MVNFSLWRRWICAALLVEVSIIIPIAVQATTTTTSHHHHHKKPQRLRKKQHFKQAQSDHVIVDQVHAANSLNQQNAAQQSAGQFHTPEPSAAYVKCRSMLEGAAGDDSIVEKSEYVQFLIALTGGNVDADSFEDLTGRWTSFFYQTACGQGGQCDGDGVAIVLNDTTENYEQIVAFCSAVTQHATTTAVLNFGYSIQYNTETISVVSHSHSSGTKSCMYKIFNLFVTF